MLLLFCLSLLGPGVNAVSHKLEAGRSGSVEVGAAYSLWCRVEEGATVERCVWQHDQEGEMTVDGDNLLDNNSKVVTGLSVNNSDTRLGCN